MDDLTYRISELERKLSNILRFGTIVELEETTALVRVQTGEITSRWLPWATRRAGTDREWWMPEEQEQVLILSPSGDLAQGLVLPATYQDAFPANGTDRNIHRISYANGDIVEHNKQTGAYNISMAGEVTIKAAKINLQAAVEQTGGDMTSDGISAQQHLHDKVVIGKDISGKPVQ